MKRLLTLILLGGTLAGPAQADCYVHYKAKMDDPLRLHFGIVALPGNRCPANPDRAVAARIAPAGWTLLTVVEQSTDTPTAQQRANAGEFYLRY